MTIHIPHTFSLAILLGLAACSGNPQETEQDGKPTSARTEKAEMAKEKTMENVVNQYLSIKDALVVSDAESAQAGAVALLGVVDATKMPLLQQKTKEMAAVNNLDSLRIHFDSLSVALYEQVKQQPDSNRVLYKQYCPMAFNNRGAFWLSTHREIKNPYFGDEMLTCGRVEEEITF